MFRVAIAKWTLLVFIVTVYVAISQGERVQLSRKCNRDW